MIRRFLALLAAASLAVAPVAAAQETARTARPSQRGLLEYPSIHHPVVSDGGMVASQDDQASEAGAAVLRRGGNAVDAAVATALVLAVTLPRAGNIGGDGFMVLHLADRNLTTSIDYRGVAPQAARLDMFLDAQGRENDAVSSVGWKAAAVPGTVAGLWLAHSKYGKRPWAELVQPAVDIAEKGMLLSHDESFAFDWGRERLSTSPQAKRTFYKADGGLYAPRERLRQPELAWTLRQIQRGGADAFYRGPVAQRFAADMRANGGLITLQDLASYRAIERPPLVGTYRGLTVYTMAPASAGGATLLQMLNVLERFDLKALGVGSAQSLHLMAEAMKLAYADRYRFLGDPGFVRAPVRGFISKPYAAERAALISADRARNTVELMPAGDPWRFESPSTTHFSVVDAQGNAVSNTYTLGSDFGSGVSVEGAGFLLNNQMNNFAHTDAAAAAAQGRPAPLNAMAGGKRMLSTMTPTMVFRDGKPWLVTGTPGGSTIIDTILQIIVNVADHGLNVAEAVHQPRIFQGAAPGPLNVEPNFNPDTIALLKAKGHVVRPYETMGSAQSIVVENSRAYGAADPRRPGALAVAP
ncbi:MAG TPA: gamma-glutamyltransferase [Caulobacteraceae bacterium]|jgi:gamma-glutamyltranspeptidase/glutathione hydrolase